MKIVTRRTALKGAMAIPAVAATAPLAAPALATAPPALNLPDRPLFGAAHWTLPNGLRVVLAENRRAPVAAHYLFVAAGSAEDPSGKSGIAHYMEHMMFKGTEKHPAGEFSKVVSALGGQENAFTSYDYTAYYQRVAREHLETMMEFESDRMANLSLDPAVVAPERDVVLEERRMRVETDPGAQLSEAMAAALYVHHP
jgi:zinc protease